MLKFKLCNYCSCFIYAEYPPNPKSRTQRMLIVFRDFQWPTSLLKSPHPFRWSSWVKSSSLPWVHIWFVGHSCMPYPTKLQVQAIPNTVLCLALLSEKQVTTTLRLSGLSQVSRLLSFPLHWFEDGLSTLLPLPSTQSIWGQGEYHHNNIVDTCYSFLFSSYNQIFFTHPVFI